jgi:hypothetical protein
MINIHITKPWKTYAVIAVAWQLLMTLLGIFLAHTVSDHAVASPLNHMAQWDGGWFMSIISGNGYAVNGAAPVFYPLFPLAVDALQILSLHVLSVTGAALIVNTLALWVALVGLARIAETFVDAKYIWLVVALFLTSPAAIFMHFLYAEALFCALAFWAYAFALRRQWLPMVLLLSLLMIVKIPALLIVGLCGLEYLRAHDWSIKKAFNKQLFWFGLMPVGFICYGIYLQQIRGDFLAMFHGYHYNNDWTYQVFNPNIILPILRACKESILLLIGRVGDYSAALVNSFLPFVGLVLLSLASLYALYRRGKFLPLGIAGLASIVFFTINSNAVSVHRYLLACFILYLVPVLLAQTYKRYASLLLPVLYVGSVLQAVLFTLFLSGHFAG